MPSKKPRLMTYTTEKIIRKFEHISKKENRSISKQLEFLVIKQIEKYEEENGTIILEEEKETNNTDTNNNETN